MKHSKQRDTILKIINESCEHLDAYQIYELVQKEIPNISLGTIYRNLNQLSDIGQIKKISISDGNDRFDKTICSHSHFYCVRCSKLLDIKIKLETTELEECQIISHDIVLNGICKDCLEKER